LIILTTDPEHLKSSRVVENIFPKQKPVYRVCAARDFTQTLNHFFGGEGVGRRTLAILLSNLDDETEAIDTGSDELSAAADNELVKLVNKIIVDAYNQGASDIHIEPMPGKGKTGCDSARTAHCFPT